LSPTARLFSPPAPATRPPAGRERVCLRLPHGQASLWGTRHAGVSRFGAIPYAQAPVGERRFAAPLPAPLPTELDATGTGPVAPQGPSALARVVGPQDAPQSEDCLNLTVWTPAADTQRRPVIVWCHGGAWQSGGVLETYDGEALARRGDVVVVGINARLGALGWLLAEGGTANLGLLDLELAFQWVREHIAAFGGDPEQITAMGQSAGASNVAALLVRRRCGIRRAILQSAPLGRGLRSPEAAAALCAALLRAAGVDTLQQARRLPVDSLLRAQRAPEVAETLRTLADGHGLFAPVSEATLPALSLDAAAQVDVLIGWNRDEMRAFGEADEAQTEQRFAAPARQWAAQAARSGRQAWLYRFDGPPGLPLGACHCAELPFVFNTFEAWAEAPLLAGLDPAEGQRLSQVIQDAWLDFVHGRALPWAPSPELRVFA
jgi:para-nitrobenzyl esterase